MYLIFNLNEKTYFMSWVYFEASIKIHYEKITFIIEDFEL